MEGGCLLGARKIDHGSIPSARLSFEIAGGEVSSLLVNRGEGARSAAGVYSAHVFIAHVSCMRDAWDAIFSREIVGGPAAALFT